MNKFNNINKRDDTALANFKKICDRNSELDVCKDLAKETLSQDVDSTRRDLGFQKEELNEQAYGKFFKGKKQFVKDYEQYVKENEDVEI